MDRGATPGVTCVGDVNSLVFGEAENNATHASDQSINVETFCRIVRNPCQTPRESDIDGAIDRDNFGIRAFRA